MPVSCDDEIDDIEDLLKMCGELGQERMTNEVVIRSRRKKRTQQPHNSEDLENGNDNEMPPLLTSVIPGTQKVYLKTWGCTHNSSDGEYMAGQLAAYGYQIVQDKSEAHLWVLNSCTVKTPAEDHFRNEIRECRRMGKHLVVSGCIPQGAPRSPFLQGISTVGVRQIHRIVEVVEETLKGNTVRLLGGGGKNAGGGSSLLLPKIRRNPLVEIVPINTGCLNQCTYCKTKHARGQLGSYSPEEIVARVVQSFSEGVCEVWLTSEDTGAYGRDIGVTLPDLLWQIVEVVPDGCMLRLGMTNPPYILEHLTEMAKILNHPKVYSFLHVPVQSGSDAVLAEMKREYSVKEFKEVVDFLTERVPGLTVATDIICGFPTETEEDFAATLDLCQQYRFPSLFINQFYPRPGTPAAKLPRIPTQEVKKRTKELWNFFQSYRPYEGRIGQVYNVLTTEVSHDGQYYVGHNKSYEQVLVPKKEALLGKIVTVQIASEGKHFMKGEPLEDQELIQPSLKEPLRPGQVSGLDEEVAAAAAAATSMEGRSMLALAMKIFLITILIRLSWLLWAIY